MYEEYYGFAQPPFSLTPDPKFLYRSESHDSALQQVWQAIRRKEGFIVLAGDIGTGKTTLCRTILEQFDPTTFTALILNPFLSQDDLLREVLLSYGVVSREAFRTGRLGAATRHDLIRTLHDFLLSLEPIRGSAVLIIDEAQHLSPDVLEEIRILSNLETNDRKLLLIVLVGQLDLLDVLRDPNLRQLDQRISIRCVLKPLDREGVEAYITHRLWVARGSTVVTFSPEAIDLVYSISGGVPRVVNLLCDRALMAGAAAQTDRIGEALIREAAASLTLTAPPAAEEPRVARAGSVNWRVALIGLAVLGLVLAGAYYWLGRRSAGASTSVDLPPVARPNPQSMGMAVPAALPAPETLPSLTRPDLESGAFVVIVGTYETPAEVDRASAMLTARKLPYYAADVRVNDAVQRRLLVGRFKMIEDAAKVLKEVAPEFPTAKIVYGWFERVP